MQRSRRRSLLAGATGLAMMAALLPATTADAQTTPTTGFSDVSATATHRLSIELLASEGVLAGYDDGTFRPGQRLTRGQMAAIVTRAFGLDNERAPQFTDVAGTHHADAIAAAAEAGIIFGYRDDTFRPNATIRRDQAAAMLGRAFEVDEVTTGPFTDLGGNVHAGYVNALAELGIARGTTATTFGPTGLLRRDQAAAFINRGFRVDVTLVATNDIHGRLAPPSVSLTPEGASASVPVGGAAYLATHLANVRDRARNSLHVDAGDLVGATPVLSNLFFDDPTVEAANLMGMDVQTVGNHEFDRGADDVLRRLEGGCFGGDCDYRGGTEFEGQEFETLSANVVDEVTGEPLTESWVAYEFDGIEVGFVGVTTQDTPTVVNPTGIEGLEFLAEADAVNAAVTEMQDEGIEAIVVLMHEGGTQDGTYNQCENFRGAAATAIAEFDDAVDVVVTAHTHRSYVCEYEGKLVTSAGEYGTIFTNIEMHVDRSTGDVAAAAARNTPVTRDVAPHPGIVELIERYEELAGPALAEVVGVSTVEIPRTTRSAESAQGNLATDALRQQFEDVDFAFQNSGGLRADLTNEEQVDEDGNFEITRRDVLEVWPFGNTVAVAEVDGPTLEAILANGVREIGGGRFIQVSGLRIGYRIDSTVPLDQNNGFPRGVVTSVEYWQHPDVEDGTPVDLSAAATHRIAMNDFMAVGGDGYPNISASVVLLGDPLENYIIEYLQDTSPVSPQVQGRIFQTDSD
ncbi:S-layer homology domain-containing protein [Egicoccus halophilus]|uniref:SLH domain-containing protein n=1 Tax=Egicoccus halophilus TaxID=1670830 RepID=A0A8J3ET41_9ACTN|nr:S-layer homology domain-containing protein [Egicoccus halophilus]GGI03072.1 hypothetical protein GCM10011354_02520 [Egicoccus halophilus]